MAEEGEVKVLGAWASPFALRPRIALNLKSVAYDHLEEAPGGAKSDLLLRSNPHHRKIPVLIHRNQPLAESLVILHYIDDTWSAPHLPTLLPDDPYRRAVARFWASFIDQKWTPWFLCLRDARSREKREAAMAEIKAGLGVLEGALEECGGGRGFFGGEELGLVDIALGSFLGWLRVVEMGTGARLIDGAATPGLAAWADRFCAHPAVKGVMPETKKLLEFSKVLRAKIGTASSTTN